MDFEQKKKKCGDVHKFRGNPAGLGEKHPLHDEEIECSIEDALHFGNHSGKAKDGTPVHWVRAIQLV